MTNLLGQLLPLALLGFLAPVPLAIVVTLLMTKGGLAKALGYVASATGVYLIVGALVLMLPLDSLGSAASVVGGVLLVASGLVLWWFAFSQFRLGRRAAEPAPPFLGRLGAQSLQTVMLGGCLITLVNVKQFGLFLIGTSRIVRSDVSSGQEWVALIVFVLVFQAGQLVLITAYAAAQDRASTLLVRFHDWLLPRMRLASVVLGSVVGALFLLLGAELLGS